MARKEAWAIVVVAAILSFAPVAQSQFTGGATDLVRDATVDVTDRLSLLRLETDPERALECGVVVAYDAMKTAIDQVPSDLPNTPDLPGTPLPDPKKEDLNVFVAAETVIDRENGTLSFAERSSQNGCGIITGEYPSPLGAAFVRFSFQATREVVSPEDQAQVRFVQNFHFSTPQSRNQTVELFRPETRNATTTVAELYTLAASRYTLTWEFADLSSTVPISVPANVPIPSQGVAQTVSSTISDIVVEYPNVPLIETVRVRDLGSRDVDGSREQTNLVEMDLDLGLVGNGVAIVRLELAPGTQLDSIIAPEVNKTIPPELYQVTFESGQIGPTVVVLGKPGTRIDPGTYGFVVKTVTPLPPVIPFEPTRVQWLLVASMPIPAVAGLFSTRASVLAWRNSTGAHQRAARGVLAMVAFLAVAYLATVSLLLVLAREAMEVLPLSAPAVAGYGLLALLFLGFLLLLQRANVVAARDAAAQRRAQAEALKRSNEELEQFAYVASHDLQEPLRTVANFSTLLQRRYGGKLGPEGEEFIGHTVAGAKRMQRLIQDLLAYSRIGQEPRSLVPVNVGQCAQQAIGDLHAMVQSTKARIEVTELPTVMGDSTQLEQLFTNLIGNALKYRHPERTPVVRIFAARRGAEWLVSIADNGIGIAAEHRTRIFQVFQRLHGRDVEGTGIGLAICQKIVVRHGGRIWVDSEPGQGSTFNFTLPAAPAR